jgi:thiamine-monophosphate kinase
LHAPVSSLGEHALISRITARLASQRVGRAGESALPPWVVVGPGDDAAVIEPERNALDVLTTDALVEGVHFDRRFVPSDAIGYRALAVNLSDLAAMGARPRAALLSLILPETLETLELDGMIDGLLTVAAAYRVSLIGGNVTRTPGPLTIDVTAIGSVHRRRILTRAGARPGDEVYVTGTLGDAAVGLRSLRVLVGGPEGPPLLSRDASPIRPTTCEHRYLRPDPRVRAGVVVGRTRAATSCMDLSDGLADAVRQIAQASGVGITLDGRAIPISDQSRAWHEHQGLDPLHTALTGGDDYELIFTVRPTQRRRFIAARQLCADLPITRIGVVTKARDLLVKEGDRARELPAGYEHFGPADTARRGDVG